MSQYIPYTYLIGWSDHNIFYYGVRTKAGCNPGDLWVKYFTSSKIVAAKRSLLGEPDIIQIRQTFSTRAKALTWEETVLKRLNVLVNTKWLNQSTGGKDFTNKGSPRSAECRAKISEKRRVYIASLTPEEKETRAELSREAGRKGAEKIGAKAKERLATEEGYAKMVDAHNTPEYKAAAKERRAALELDPSYVQKRAEVMRSKEYRQKQSEGNYAKYEKDPSIKDRISNTLKEKLASPEHRQLMAERSKLSTAKRLASREINKMNNIMEDYQVIKFVEYLCKKDSTIDYDDLLERARKRQVELKKKMFEAIDTTMRIARATC